MNNQGYIYRCLEFADFEHFVDGLHKAGVLDLNHASIVVLATVRS